jgi:hypothetical protein
MADLPNPDEPAEVNTEALSGQQTSQHLIAET